MPVAANASEALTTQLREFLRRPTHEGLFLHLAAEGVDLVVQVSAEAPAGEAASCAECGHRTRVERGRRVDAPACSMCKKPVALAPADPGEKVSAFTWRASWARDGHEGLGMGATIDEGSFMDEDVLAGVADVHACLRLFLPLFDSVNVTNMKDYRALSRLGAPFQAEVQLAES